MFGLPLHPAIVHLPLGIAAALPLLALATAWAHWRNLVPRSAMALVVMLQVFVAGAALVAVRSGLRDLGVVADAVPEVLLDAHEDAGWLFLFSACAVMLVGLAGMLVKEEFMSRVLSLVAAAGTVVLAALAVHVGHLGGELVYHHDAAGVFAKNPGGIPEPPAPEDGE